MCTNDDAIEGTPDANGQYANNAPAPVKAPAPSTTTPVTGAQPTCGMLGATCSDDADPTTCCTDLGYFCSGGVCTDDDILESS